MKKNDKGNITLKPFTMSPRARNRYNTKVNGVSMTGTREQILRGALAALNGSSFEKPASIGPVKKAKSAPNRSSKSRAKQR